MTRSLPLLAPEGASATVSCAYTDAGTPGPAENVLAISANDEEVDAAAISRHGGEIGVSDDRTITPVACSGGTPTVANVDAIAFSGATGTSLAIDERAGAFAPGATDEGDGASEIEFSIAWDDDGFLAVNGQPGGNRLSLGATPAGLGLDLVGGGAPPDVDAALTNVSFVVARGSAERDTLSAIGATPFAGPFERDVALDGKGGGDRLRGGPLEDDLIGGKGRDRIDARDGERDQVDCGRGGDRVKADRRDRLAGCERVRL